MQLFNGAAVATDCKQTNSLTVLNAVSTDVGSGYLQLLHPAMLASIWPSNGRGVCNTAPTSPLARARHASSVLQAPLETRVLSCGCDRKSADQPQKGEGRAASSLHLGVGWEAKTSMST
jgi:hypothetical protein